MPSDHQRRLERERDFHDERFGGHNDRARTAKYYQVDAGKQAYRAAIDDLAPSADVLEYGCGPGSAAIGLARLGATVTGIDISPVAVERARTRLDRTKRARVRRSVRFEVMDAHRLDVPDQSFDVVCGSGILHHLDLTTALPEIARVLRPDGTAVFYEPLGTNPFINLYRRCTPAMRTTDEHPLGPTDFAMAENYFTAVEREEHTFLALAGVILNRLGPARRLIPTLHRADRWLFDHVPGTRRLAWVVVVRLKPERRGR